MKPTSHSIKPNKACKDKDTHNHLLRGNMWMITSCFLMCVLGLLVRTQQTTCHLEIIHVFTLLVMYAPTSLTITLSERLQLHVS